MTAKRRFDERLVDVERRLSALEPKPPRQSDLRVGFFVLFIITLPLVIAGYVLAGIIYALVKPFKYFSLTEEERSWYQIDGEFNECEYMWSSISPRYGKPK